MASPNVTDLVSRLHSNIDSIYQTLNLLSDSSSTHEKEISRLSADRESQIQELEQEHKGIIKELALQREKEAGEIKRARDEEEKQAEAARQREMDELKRKHAQAADERRAKAEKAEEERLKLRKEEDVRKARDKEEKEKSLRSTMEDQMERLEDELERKVEEGKKALKELDENRKAINAQIDAALNTPTVIPVMNFRSRRKSGVKVLDPTANSEVTNTVQNDEHANEERGGGHSPSVIAKDLDEVANAPAAKEAPAKNRDLDIGSNYDDSAQSLDVTPIPGTMASAGASDSAPISETMQLPIPKADNDDIPSTEQKFTSQAPIGHQTEKHDSKESPSMVVTPDPNTSFDEPSHTPPKSLQKSPIDYIDNILQLENNIDESSHVKSTAEDEKATDEKPNFEKDHDVNVERKTISIAGQDVITPEVDPKDPRDDSQERFSQDTRDESCSASNDLKTDNIPNHDDDGSKPRSGSRAIQENMGDHSRLDDEIEDNNQPTQNISLATTKKNSFSSENGHDGSQSSAVEEDDTTLLGNGNEEASTTDIPNHLAGYEKFAHPPKNVDLPNSTKDSDPKPDSRYAKQSSPRETVESGADSTQSDNKEEHPVTDRALESTSQSTENVIESHEPTNLIAELPDDRHMREEQSHNEMTEDIVPSQASQDEVSKFNKETAERDTIAGDQVKTSSYVTDDKASSLGIKLDINESSQAVSSSHDTTERQGSNQYQPAKSHESGKLLSEPRREEEIFSGDEDKENSSAEVSDIPASRELNIEADQHNEVLHSEDRSEAEEEDLGAEDVNDDPESRRQQAESTEEPPQNMPVENSKEEKRQADESTNTPSIPSDGDVSSTLERKGRTMNQRNSRLRSSSPLWKEIKATDLSEQEDNHTSNRQVVPTSPESISSEHNSPLSLPNTEDGPKAMIPSKQDVPASPMEQDFNKDSSHKVDKLTAANSEYSSDTSENDVDISPKNLDTHFDISKEGQPQNSYDHSRDSPNAFSSGANQASAPDPIVTSATFGEHETGVQQNKELDKPHSSDSTGPEFESKSTASEASRDEIIPSPDTEQRRVRFSDSHEIVALPGATKNEIEQSSVEEPKQFEASEIPLSTPIQDRWAQIRKIAAHRAATNQEAKDKKPSVDATSTESLRSSGIMDAPLSIDRAQSRKSVVDRVVPKQQAGEIGANAFEPSHDAASDDAPNAPDNSEIPSSITQINNTKSIEIGTSPTPNAPKKAWWEFRKDSEARNKDHMAHEGGSKENQRYDTEQTSASLIEDLIPDIPLRSASRSRLFSHSKAEVEENRKEADFRPQTPVNHAAQTADDGQLAESPVTVVSSDDLFADDDDESDEDFDGPHRQPPTFASIPPQKAEDSSGEQTPKPSHESNSSREIDPFSNNTEEPKPILTRRSSSASVPLIHAQSDVPLMNQMANDSQEIITMHHDQADDESSSEYSQDHHVLAAIEAESGETTPFYSSHSYQDPMEVPLRGRSHTTDTVPSFESFDRSDSESPPRTPDSRSSSPFVENPIEPTIRQSWQSSPSNARSGDSEEEEEEELKAATAPLSVDFDPYNPQVYGHLVTPKNSLAKLKLEDVQDSTLYEQSNQDSKKLGDRPLQSPLEINTSTSPTRKRLSSSASSNADSTTNSPSRLPRRTSRASTPTINPASATFFQKTRTLFESPTTSPSRTSRPLSGIFANRTSGASSPSWKSSRPNSLSSYKVNSPARERRPTLLNDDDIIIPKSLDGDGRPPSPVDVIPTGQRESDEYDNFQVPQSEPKRAGSFPLGGLMNSIHNPYHSRILTGTEREPLLRDGRQENGV